MLLLGNVSGLFDLSYPHKVSTFPTLQFAPISMSLPFFINISITLMILFREIKHIFESVLISMLHGSSFCP